MSLRGRSVHLRHPSAANLEWRERTLQIRAAARRGKAPADIADLYRLPIGAVERVLASAGDPHVSDPTHLLSTRKEAPGLTPADVQMYWLGFLTAAGHIWGQGASLTLVITLGEKSQPHMDTFMADFADPHVRYEFCRSSVLGWQLYVRDQGLCKALIPWGITSELYGDDPALLDDLPKEFAAPFLRGYIDGNWPARPPADGEKDAKLILQGTFAVLTGINAMIQRCWGISGGAVSARPPRAELRFASASASREILSQVNAYTSRARPAPAKPTGTV
jgi:hypothetical protein